MHGRVHLVVRRLVPPKGTRWFNSGGLFYGVSESFGPEISGVGGNSRKFLSIPDWPSRNGEAVNVKRPAADLSGSGVNWWADSIRDQRKKLPTLLAGGWRWAGNAILPDLPSLYLQPNGCGFWQRQ